MITQSSLVVNRLDMFTFADCSLFLLILSSSDSMRRCMVSNAVKLMLNAIGPLTQFIVTPLKKPRIPCSSNSRLIVIIIDGGLDDDSWYRALCDNGCCCGCDVDAW